PRGRRRRRSFGEPRSRSAAKTASRVRSATSGLPFRTRETVAIDTPACSAMSFSRARGAASRSLTGPLTSAYGSKSANFAEKVSAICGGRGLTRVGGSNVAQNQPGPRGRRRRGDAGNKRRRGRVAASGGRRAGLRAEREDLRPEHVDGPDQGGGRRDRHTAALEPVRAAALCVALRAGHVRLRGR